VEASQLGVTLLHSVASGVHVGATLKYVRGRADDGRTEDDVDLDVGALAVVGSVRLGGTVKNLREPEFGSGAIRLPRQVRVGAAFDAERIGGPPLLIAVDGDVRAYVVRARERRVVAMGAEYWLLARRLGLRAGARVNTVGAEERGGTAGVSVSPRAGMFLEGFVIRGRALEERGWGVAARVSY
jgi:hypothetical protein